MDRCRMNLDIPAEVRRAEPLIRPYILHTPLLPSAVLGEAAGTPVWAKLENRQHTGSFKLRGALSWNVTGVFDGLISSSTTRDP